MIPQAAVAPIAQACLASLYDVDALGVAIATAGNSAIPLVKALGKLIASEDAGAERYVHLGATSQDVMDTGLVLQLRRALVLIETDLARLGDVLAAQAQRYADDAVGRAHLVAARDAGHAGDENRRLAGRGDAQPPTLGRAETAPAGAAIWRRLRHPGGAG